MNTICVDEQTFEVIYCAADDAQHNAIIARALRGKRVVSNTGRMIKQLRLSLGISQGAVAELAQVNRETIWRWENGVANADRILAAVELLAKLQRKRGTR